MRQTSYFPFIGGENHSTPALSITAGELIASLNYEPAPDGGYRRIDGYERFDGQSSPAEVLFDNYADETAWITEMESRRSLIGEVPGEGNILGVWYYDGKSYAFRNKVGGVTAGMYESSASGWVEVTTGTTLSPDGRYEFLNYNFYGHAGLLKMYGCSGTNKAFEFDGTTYTEITTGMTTDTPTHIFGFKNHLFLSFTGGSAQHSPIGEPSGTWAALTGASEFGIGDEITGFELATADTLAIFGRNRTALLQGASAADWVLTWHSDRSGAIEGSIQRLAAPIYLDDRGVTTLAATQAYGDFKSNTMSKKVDKLLLYTRNLLTTSVRVRNKDQYRMFFSDGGCMTLAFVDGKLSGILRQDYNKPVLCACSSEDANGDEILFFGSDDGYVYQMDKGYSFDGEYVDAWIRPVFNHFKSPEHTKRFFKIVLEIDADESTTLNYVPTYDYGGLNTPSSQEGEITVYGGGGFWDAAVWEDFYYDTQVISTAYGYLQGVGKNFSLYIRSYSQYEKPHTLQGVIIHYSIKGLSK